MTPSYQAIFDVFNVKHLIPYKGDIDDTGNANLRANFLQIEEDDAGQFASAFIESLG